MATKNEKVKPIVIKDVKTGDPKYTLEFSRKTVATAERRGFQLDQIGDFPLTRCQELFYFAFLKNHRNLSKVPTDELFDDLGGIEAEGLVERLVALYNDAIRSTNVGADGEVKNAKYALEL